MIANEATGPTQPNQPTRATQASRETDANEGRVEAIRCTFCGGLVLFDPDAKGLLCKHCAKVSPVPQLGPVGAGPREMPLHEGLTSAPRGLGTAALLVQCNECGARVTLAPEERATRCTYCASPAVAERPADPTLIQPETLVPFSVSQPRATAAFHAWLSSLWFRPRDLHAQARVEGVHGVYLPYWTFDADVKSDWTGERGHHYYETEYVTVDDNGESRQESRQVQKTRWSDTRGHRHDRVDDLLICASRGVREDLARELCSFDTTQLVPYSPGYLCGWRAESYAIVLPSAWALAQGLIQAEQERRCTQDIGGDEQRNLSATHTYSRETFKHVLLPLFVLAYRYRGKPMQVLINGQTGEVVGKAPLSLWKILLATLPILIVSLLFPPLLVITIPGYMVLGGVLYWNRKDWFV